MPLDRPRAASLLQSFRGRKVAVLGDLMLDHFIWGAVSRISPEAPVPVVRVTRESFHLGGSGNVVRNLKALGASPMPVGIVGDDEAARRIFVALSATGVAAEGIVTVDGRPTTKKTRIIAHAQQVVRFDREEDAILPEASAASILKAARAALKDAAALVISDYEKGVVGPALLRAILPEAHALKIPVVVDPKPAHAEHYSPITAITPNGGEAAQISGIRIRDEEDARKAGETILKRLGCRAVLLTRGERGMLLFESGAPVVTIPTAAREVFDVTGAGDTVVAAFVLSLSAGASMREAAELANAAAGVVVAKVGTAVVSPEEILDALSR